VTSQYQRRGRYLPESNRHPGKMLPAIARRAITSYSNPGDLVVDPMCGIGTTLVEAVHAGRHAVGVELEGRWKALAEGNLTFAWEQSASGRGTVVQGDARQLPRLLTTGARDFLSPATEPKLARLPYGARPPVAAVCLRPDRGLQDEPARRPSQRGAQLQRRPAQSRPRARHRLPRRGGRGLRRGGRRPQAGRLP
jgi:modification methylase